MLPTINYATPVTLSIVCGIAVGAFWLGCHFNDFKSRLHSLEEWRESASQLLHDIARKLDRLL